MVGLLVVGCHARALWPNGIVIQWYVAPYTDNTEWYVALMLAAGVWGGVGGA